MISALLSKFAAGCEVNSFFGISPWYKYLELKTDRLGQCSVDIQIVDATGTLQLNSLLLIGLGVIDMLLRIGALVAVGFIVYAGVQYVISQGEPDKAKKALGTIINALVGLGITIVAAAVVSFIGHQFGDS